MSFNFSNRSIEQITITTKRYRKWTELKCSIKSNKKFNSFNCFIQTLECQIEHFSAKKNPIFFLCLRSRVWIFSFFFSLEIELMVSVCQVSKNKLSHFDTHNRGKSCCHKDDHISLSFFPSLFFLFLFTLFLFFLLSTPLTFQSYFGSLSFCLWVLFFINLIIFPSLSLSLAFSLRFILVFFFS